MVRRIFALGSGCDVASDQSATLTLHVSFEILTIIRVFCSDDHTHVQHDNLLRRELKLCPCIQMFYRDSARFPVIGKAARGFSLGPRY
jgi:hypothetical protein